MAEGFLDQIRAQPDALERLVAAYKEVPLRAEFARAASILGTGRPLCFTGMGASYFALLAAKAHAETRGRHVRLEATGYLASAARSSVYPGQPVLLLSQSGRTVEAALLARDLPSSCPLVLVTNHPDSLLAERADVVLPIRVNCAANCNSVTFATLARCGATDVEPGSGLSGSSLLHALQDLPERPAQVSVSEVTYHWDGQLYTLGGGLSFIDSVEPWTPRCIVGRSFARRAKPVHVDAPQGRHRLLRRVHHSGPPPSVGDTVVYALPLPQIFVNRSYVAAVGGISRGKPKLEGVFDSACNELDEGLVPIPAAETRARIERVARTYGPRAPEGQSGSADRRWAPAVSVSQREDRW